MLHNALTTAVNWNCCINPGHPHLGIRVTLLEWTSFGDKTWYKSACRWQLYDIFAGTMKRHKTLILYQDGGSLYWRMQRGWTSHLVFSPCHLTADRNQWRAHVYGYMRHINHHMVLHFEWTFSHTIAMLVKLQKGSNLCSTHVQWKTTVHS